MDECIRTVMWSWWLVKTLKVSVVTIWCVEQLAKGLKASIEALFHATNDLYDELLTTCSGFSLIDAFHI